MFKKILIFKSLNYRNSMNEFVYNSIIMKEGRKHDNCVLIMK